MQFFYFRFTKKWKIIEKVVVNILYFLIVIFKNGFGCFVPLSKSGMCYVGCAICDEKIWTETKSSLKFKLNVIYGDDGKFRNFVMHE